ncbi:helix-turn-helix domain-containing protein [Klebsiella variicola]|uniref:helix-turn-helix domain-containing protein n=1 Tax=Klebsiella variicola TaxID=244366 RepID=UPI0034D3702F
MSTFVISDNNYLILGFESLFHKDTEVISFKPSDLNFNVVKKNDIIFIDCTPNVDFTPLFQHVKLCKARIYFLLRHDSNIAKKIMSNTINTRIGLKGIISSIIIHLDINTMISEEELKLTKKECLIIKMVLKGYSENEISGFFTIKVRTVRYHISMVLKKIGVNSVADLYRLRNVIYNNFFI